MAIKNGRYKDKKGVIRHFETNENMVITDDGQKTLKQKISEIVESITTKISSHNTDGTAHADIRSTLALKSNKTYVDTYTLMKKSSITTFATDIASGMYYVNASTDGTFPYNYGVLTVFDGGSSERTAIFMTTGNDRKTYVNYFIIGSDWIGWKEVITEDSDKLKNCLSFKTVATDLDTLTEEGTYNVTPSTLNSPLSGAYGKCLVFKNPDNNAISQMVFKTSGGGYDCLYARNSYYSSTKLWIPWLRMAYNRNTSVSLLNGWTLHNGSLDLIRVGDMCFMSMNIKGGSLSASTSVFTLPSGFAPVVSTPIFGVHEGTKVVEIFVADSSGILRSSGAGISESTTQIIINASWRCA